MKKVISLMLSILLVAALVVPAFAAEGCKFTVTPSAAKAAAGETVTVTVEVAQAEKCTEFAVVVEFDADKFEFVSYDTKGAGFSIPIDGAAAGAKETGFAAMGGWTASKTEAVEPVAAVPAGVVGTITLKAKADADVVITAKAEAANAGADVAASAEVVEVKEEPPVTEPPVADVLWGDANGDGFVDSFDSYPILKYDLMLIGEDELDMTAADVSGDGFVDSYDATLILMYDVMLIVQFPAEK